VQIKRLQTEPAKHLAASNMSNGVDYSEFEPSKKTQKGRLATAKAAAAAASAAASIAGSSARPNPAALLIHGSETRFAKDVAKGGATSKAKGSRHAASEHRADDADEQEEVDSDSEAQANEGAASTSEVYRPLHRAAVGYDGDPASVKAAKQACTASLNDHYH
jgi:hypothetical protein